MARVYLGLSGDEFWGLSILEYSALLDRYAERERILNYRAGITAAAVYNVNRDPKKHPPIQPLVFFETPEEPENEWMTDEEIDAAMQRFGEAVRAYEGRT